MSKGKDYAAAADWAENEMTLDPASATALRGEAAAAFGRELLERATAGRPSIDPAAVPGKHSPARQVRLAERQSLRLDRLAERQGRRPSALLRDALDEYLDRAEAVDADAAAG